MKATAEEKRRIAEALEDLRADVDEIVALLGTLLREDKKGERK